MLKLLISAAALYFIIYLFKNVFINAFLDLSSKKYVCGKKGNGRKYQYGKYVSPKKTISNCVLCNKKYPPNINIDKFKGISIVITINEVEESTYRYIHGIKIYANREGNKYLDDISKYVFSLYSKHFSNFEEN